MSKRKTVLVNLPVVLPLIKEVCRSNVAFTKQIRGKDSGWVTEWSRGKNLPSPEEAAKMCTLLHTTPEVILLLPEDIALVQGILDEEGGAGVKKSPGIAGGGTLDELNAAINNWTADQLDEAMLIILNRKAALKGKK